LGNYIFKQPLNPLSSRERGTRSLGFWLELGKAELSGDILPYYLDRHIAPDLVKTTTDYITKYMWAFFQFYNGGYIRDITCESLMVDLVIDSESVDFPSATGYYPFCII